MSTTRKTKRVHVHSAEISMGVRITPPFDGYGTYTYYVDDNAIFSVTVPAAAFSEMLAEMQKGVNRVLLGNKHDNLILPDMGDFQVFYFKDSKGRSLLDILDE